MICSVIDFIGCTDKVAAGLTGLITSGAVLASGLPCLPFCKLVLALFHSSKVVLS